MLQLPEEIQKAGLKAQMMLQVHDELMFEVPEDELVETTKLVQRVMENAHQLAIPLSTEAGAAGTVQSLLGCPLPEGVPHRGHPDTRGWHRLGGLR